MGARASVSTNLERRQTQAAREFIEGAGYPEARDIVFVPDDTEPLSSRSVHVKMPLLRFTYAGALGRKRGEISAVGLEVPIR